jgi:hypothetical protein
MDYVLVGLAFWLVGSVVGGLLGWFIALVMVVASMRKTPEWWYKLIDDQQ